MLGKKPTEMLEANKMNMADLENKLIKCQLCEQDTKIQQYLKPMEYKKPESFIGKNFGQNNRILLSGHSPKVRSAKQADIVLKLNVNNGHIYKYIKTSVTDPLGIEIDDLYATNLIKCMSSKLPEDIDAKQKGFINNCFRYCKSLFELQIEMLRPTLILGLSETTLQIITKEYSDETYAMRDVNGRLLELNINGYPIQYIPIVHIPDKNKRIKDRYFPQQTNNLMACRDILKKQGIIS